MRTTMVAMTLLALGTVGAGRTGPGRPESPEDLPFYNTAELAPEWLTEREAADVHRAGAFRAVDQQGEAVDDSVLDGRVTLVSFFFTRCPGICPAVTTNLSRARAALPGAVQILSFSIDPAHDGVPALAGYGRAHHLQAPSWRLLHGDRDVVYAFARRSLFAESDAPTGRGADDFLHTELVFLLDGQRRVRGVYDGLVPTDVARVAEDARILLTSHDRR
jgi:protein SCO1/2